MKAPPISLKCDCGAQAKVAYGERWQCPECGRSYDTRDIPEHEYRQLQGLSRRYRMIGLGLVAVLAAFTLFLVIYGLPFQVFIALPAILLFWFTYVRPIMRRRYKRRLGELTATWELHGEART
jgi:Flp pilus assembly protein TadB